MQVTQLGRVFVKATRFLHPAEVAVDADGIRHDRSFGLVEADDRFVGSAQHSEFIPLTFELSDDASELQLTWPDGSSLSGPAAATGRAFEIDHHGLRGVSVREVAGPWQEALSAFAGRPLRLVRCLSAGGAIDVLPVTLTTTGSLRRLAGVVGAEVDAARFRAGIVLANDEAHAEDGWDGQQLRVGDVLLRMRTAVPRCQITGFNPASGIADQAVMQALIKYREKVHLPDGMLPDYATPGFASYCEVIEPGLIKLGDSAELLP
ncbi:MAG: MOSC domain-containing protein [Gammaproteobacteria bacterium]|jgi:uncharacterized protein YcbX